MLWFGSGSVRLCFLGLMCFGVFNVFMVRVVVGDDGGVELGFRMGSCYDWERVLLEGRVISTFWDICTVGTGRVFESIEVEWKGL
jgi:hypothetical protein